MEWFKNWFKDWGRPILASLIATKMSIWLGQHQPASYRLPIPPKIESFTGIIFWAGVFLLYALLFRRLWNRVRLKYHALRFWVFNLRFFRKTYKAGQPFRTLSILKLDSKPDLSRVAQACDRADGQVVFFNMPGDEAKDRQDCLIDPLAEAESATRFDAVISGETKTLENWEDIRRRVKQIEPNKPVGRWVVKVTAPFSFIILNQSEVLMFVSKHLRGKSKRYSFVHMEITEAFKNSLVDIFNKFCESAKELPDAD